MTEPERRGPPPVEPLSDAAWLRVERQVWRTLDTEVPVARPARSMRRAWWLAAPLALAAAAIAIVIATRGAARDPFASDEPARVVSGASPSSVSFEDAHVELDANTAIAMGHEHAQPTVAIEHGAAWFTVAPRRSRPAFVVRAGDVTVRVVGTRFRVARRDEQIEVEVAHGRVEVELHDMMVRLDAGQRWSSAAPNVIRSGDPIQADAGTMAVPAPVTPAPPPAPTPTPAPPAAVPAPPSLPTKPARPSVHEPSDRAEYDRLAGLEASSPEAALDGYLALARGTSAWAAPALYAAARLATDRHDYRALRLLELYLQRFPHGANATDARQLHARLQGDLP